MRKLTPEGEQVINDLAQRHGVSVDAVMSMLQAVINGNGTMAQFSHPEFGGSGQWMQGGMTMVGDMFNYGLKATVEGLCSELSNLLANQPFQVTPMSSQRQSSGGQQQQQQGVGSLQGAGIFGDTGSSAVSLFVPPRAGSSGNWWPAGLGVPNSTGAQNNVRYAYFAGPRRMAVEVSGHITLYDTKDHQIGGFSQQQGIGGSITFTSQYGVVSLADLPIISIDGVEHKPASPAPVQPDVDQVAPVQPDVDQVAPVQAADILATIERLAELKEKGAITEEEYAAKKTELLDKL